MVEIKKIYWVIKNIIFLLNTRAYNPHLIKTIIIWILIVKHGSILFYCNCKKKKYKLLLYIEFRNIVLISSKRKKYNSLEEFQ